jgi:hypothetical protein
MEANEFVKKHGISAASELVNESEWSIKQLALATTTSMLDLKRLVESHELVAIHGFEKSKEIVANAPSDDHFYSWTLGGSGVRDKTVNIGELRKAIADVESCMELANDSC